MGRYKRALRNLTFEMPQDPRGMWCSNQLCEAASLYRKQQLHKANIRSAKPMIDMRDPRRPRSANSRGSRLEEERNAEIFHENSLLLGKLSKILSGRNTIKRDMHYPNARSLLCSKESQYGSAQPDAYGSR